MSADGAPLDQSVRLDKWLWFARFCKSRALAQKLIERGQVAIDGATVTKVSAAVRPGQVIAITLGPVRRTVAVTAVGDRRGPPAQAQALYQNAGPTVRLPRDRAGLPPHKLRRVRP
jgi:ribosome-associated heat shock protein Hsp15